MDDRSAEAKRASREQHNATRCRLLTLPAELRLDIHDLSTTPDKHPNVKVPRSGRTVIPAFLGQPSDPPGVEGCLRACRTLRRELESILYTNMEVEVSFTIQFKHHYVSEGRIEAIRSWLDRLLEMRDVSCDRLFITVPVAPLTIPSWQPSKIHVNFCSSKHGWGVSRHAVVMPGHRHYTLVGTGRQVEEWVKDKNGREEGLDMGEVRRLFDILLGCVD